MQAAVLIRFNEPLEIKQVEIPQPGPDDVLIKMIACGVCHTDLHFVRGGKDARSLRTCHERHALFSSDQTGTSSSHSYHVSQAMKVSVK